MPSKQYLTAVTGGIGSGKSMVCRILQAAGYSVYVCDSRARTIMDESDLIIGRIAAEIAPEAVTDGKIDRKALAAIVFSDPAKLQTLNSIVHAEVRADITRWSARHPEGFIETAILYQSGIDTMVNEVWQVEAPAEIRIARVMQRSGLSAEEVMARIESQDSYHPVNPHPHTEVIVNDGVSSLIEQICLLMERRGSVRG